ncbi:hypothetical protein [Nakamurella sp.]|uniref:hypothetical protein n=1 Tax=Nakamurella sp. TaxID=1869182 RepID=UPI003784B437
MTQDRDSLAWDRVGRFLQDTGATGSYIADRNLKLWAKVSAQLRNRKTYTADDMAGDVASSMVAAMDNLDDIWSLINGAWQGGLAAQPLPTAFLLFRRAGKHRHVLLNPVAIPVAPQFWTMHLPQRAKIDLSGRISDPGGPEQTVDLGNLTDGVRRLARCLVAIRPKDSDVYVLETVNFKISREVGRKAEKKYHDLVAGVYDGLVYLAEPPIALAELVIVVEGRSKSRHEDGDMD